MIVGIGQRGESFDLYVGFIEFSIFFVVLN